MRRFTTGMEAGTDLTHFWDSVQTGSGNYNAEVATTGARSGSNCLRFYRTAGFSGTTGTYVEVDFGNGGAAKVHAQAHSAAIQAPLLKVADSSSRCWVRFFFKVTTAPTVSISLSLDMFRLSNDDVNKYAKLFWASSSGAKLAWGLEGDTDATAQILFAPTLDTWYRVEIECRGATGGSIAAGQQYSCNIFAETSNTVIAGATLTTASAGIANPDDNLQRCRWGMIPVGFAGASNADWRIDDIAVNDSVGKLHNTTPGYGRVVGVAVPTANGGTNNFNRGGGGDTGVNWSNVDDWVNTGAGDDYTVTPAAAATHDEQYDHTSSGTLSVSGSIKAVHVWIYHRDETGVDGTSHNFGMKDSSGKFLRSSGALFVTVGSDTEYQQGVSLGGFGVDDTTSIDSLTAWTTSEFDNAANEFWIKHTSATANEQKRIMGIRAEVEDTGGVTLGNVYHAGQKMVQGHVAG